MAAHEQPDLAPRYRVPLMLLAFVALLTGVGGGLLRLGWSVPGLGASSALLHGPLLIPGFFGTLIALERAAALGRRWAYAGPLAGGLGVLALLGGLESLGALLIGLNGLTLLAATAAAYRRQPALFTAALVAAAAGLCVGNGAWVLSGTPYGALTWWLAFLVVTIAGERLELSRFLQRPAHAEPLFRSILAGLVAGPLLSFWLPDVGARLFGVGLIVLAAWLARYDLARRTVLLQGLPRYIALCLLSGYAWLATGGLIAAVHALQPGTLGYDAALHALLLGFVFSMVLGHAPVIVPALLRVGVPFHPVFYAVLIVLHASVAIRLLGDGLALADLRAAGGLLNAVALALFVATTFAAVLRGRIQARRAASRATISARASVSRRQ